MTLALSETSSTEMRNDEFWIAACTGLQYAWGAPQASGKIKAVPEDFEVEEELGFAPDGKGEHLFLFIEKRELNTVDVQLMLARHFRQPLMRVAFSGMKDKQALTRQWFSVQTGPGSEDTISELNSDQLRIIAFSRNSRKLRRGSHRSNKFKLRIRGVKGDKTELENRMDLVQQQGVPNYFGPQRFGYGSNNLLNAVEWFGGKAPGKRGSSRGLILSAARSFLFNQVLSERVSGASWNSTLEGDVMALAGTASVFAASKAGAEELAQRLASLDIQPTGPLWGKGLPTTTGAAATLEQAVVARYGILAQGLAREGLEQERRPLRLLVQNFRYAFDQDDLELEFSLGRGCFATAVLRELLHTELT